MAAETIDIPLVIGGKDVRTGDTAPVVMPHDHRHVLADYHKATPELVQQAIDAARAAHREWSRWSFDDRAAVLLEGRRAADDDLARHVNAATMLGQSKTVFQAEIDAACEIIDFWRFNAHYAQELLDEQPISDHTMWNQLEYRALEGFVYAVTPFNFTSIAANLPTAPALMGNTVVWKPASSAMFSAHYLMQLLEEAGLPPGVINFVAGDAGDDLRRPAVASRPGRRALHRQHRGLQRHVEDDRRVDVARYRSYPRIVGETGGKDFIIAHPSADPAALAVAIVRGGFEFQGQKCSAVSRIYIPRSLWNDVRDRMVAMIDEIRMGDVRDFRNFMGAVIDKRAFDKITGYIDTARAQRDDRRRRPVRRPHRLLHPADARRNHGSGLPARCCEEIFGPVVTAYVYDDDKWEETLALVDCDVAVRADRRRVRAGSRARSREATSALRYAAGNFYINDKPTGAVVGQQPFGGARASGTNDKAGSKLNLVRWVSARTIKENFNPPRDFQYPFMAAE